MGDHHHGDDYEAGSLSLFGAVAMGTGVMIGAGIFALTGQLAQHAGGLFPLAFVSAAIVCGFSAYSYIKVCAKYPSAGGIAMILQKCYGPGVVTAGCALLMYFSMVINESLVARTFGTYTMQLFGDGKDTAGPDWLIPALGVGLIAIAFVVNILGNTVIGSVQKVMAVVKVVGIASLAVAGLWASGLSFETVTQVDQESIEGVWGFLTATAIGILAYKGFPPSAPIDRPRPSTSPFWQRLWRSVWCSRSLSDGHSCAVTRRHASGTWRRPSRPWSRPRRASLWSWAG